MRHRHRHVADIAGGVLKPLDNYVFGRLFAWVVDLGAARQLKMA
jgi:hypothetical protein